MNTVTIRTEGTEITVSDGNVAVQRIQPGPQAVFTDDLPCANPFPTAGHTKILADGTMVDGTATRTDHVAVVDRSTGLMWAVESIGDEDGDSQDHAACTKACADLRLLGYDDWRMSTRAELAALVDDTRRNPAIDTDLFPRVKPSWHWTSTALAPEDGGPVAGSSASAWGVNFSYGGVGDGRRGGDGFALAVRRAGQ
ncbi:DUF1566 domain-containing protein [Stenotrophomonas sp. AB1(2024)]|uniref:Lcl C-terminal domain-containing protein n=1 Tax=Stenotrophomonas sp. AB1(2024) TaxID=3132215 RepID=UPI0030A6DB23